MSSEEEGMSQGFGCPQRSRSKRRGATLGTCRAAFARSQNQEMWVERSWGMDHTGRVKLGCRVRNSLVAKPPGLDLSCWVVPG